MAIVGAGLGLVAAFVARRTVPVETFRSPKASGSVVLFTLFPLCGALVGALVLAKTVPWGITRAFGTPERMETTMQYSNRFRKRGCDSQLRGGPFGAFSISEVCVARIPGWRSGSDVEVTLVGKRSFLGFAVEGVAPRGHR